MTETVYIICVPIRRVSLLFHQSDAADAMLDTKIRQRKNQCDLDAAAPDHDRKRRCFAANLLPDRAPQSVVKLFAQTMTKQFCDRILHERCLGQENTAFVNREMSCGLSRLKSWFWSGKWACWKAVLERKNGRKKHLSRVLKSQHQLEHELAAVWQRPALCTDATGGVGERYHLANLRSFGGEFEEAFRRPKISRKKAWRSAERSGRSHHPAVRAVSRGSGISTKDVKKLDFFSQKRSTSLKASVSKGFSVFPLNRQESGFGQRYGSVFLWVLHLRFGKKPRGFCGSSLPFPSSETEHGSDFATSCCWNDNLLSLHLVQGLRDQDTILSFGLI